MTAVAALALVVAWLPGPAAPDVRVADLLETPAAFDAALVGEIALTGELVGDFQRRGEWVWAQLNDDAFVHRPTRDGGSAGQNIGVGVRFRSVDFAESGLHQPGGYRYRGPIVRLTGEWRFHDEQRGGESYLAVLAVEVIESETLLHDGMSLLPLAGGVALVLFGTAWPLLRRRRAHHAAQR
jgi:hypothetical protein